MARVIGIDHISLTVSDVALSKPFYRKLLEQFGVKIVPDQEDSLYGSVVEPEWSLGSARK